MRHCNLERRLAISSCCVNISAAISKCLGNADVTLSASHVERRCSVSISGVGTDPSAEQQLDHCYVAIGSGIEHWGSAIVVGSLHVNVLICEKLN
jgi:hypothetical protein